MPTHKMAGGTRFTDHISEACHINLTHASYGQRATDSVYHDAFNFPAEGSS